jgi:hypothetical protein
LKAKHSELEKEVQDLEFIINFCEENLMIKKADDLSDEEKAEIETLTKMSEKFIHIQYLAIGDKYKAYVEKIKVVIEDFYKENSESINLDEDFHTIVRTALDRLQEIIRFISLNMKNNNTNLNKREKNISELNIVIENEFNERVEKAKVRVYLIRPLRRRFMMIMVLKVISVN